MLTYISRALLLCFPVLCHPAWGQGVYAFEQPWEGRAYGIHQVVGNQVWLTGSWQNGKDGDFIGMALATFQGDSIQMSPIFELQGEDAYLMHFNKKPNSVIYIGLQYELGCRFLAQGNFIYNFNEQLKPYGKPQRINYFFKNIKEPLSEAVFIDESTLALTQGKLLVTYQVNQRKALAFNDSLSSFANLLPLSNGLFVCTEGNKFHIMNPQCKVVSSSHMGLFPKQIIPIKGSPIGYLALASRQLEVLNGSGQSVYEHNWQLLSPVFDSLHGMFYRGDSLFLLGMKNQTWVLAKLNRNFDFLDTLLLPTHGLIPIDIAIDGQWVYAVLAPAPGQEKRIGYIGRFLRRRPSFSPPAFPIISQLQVDSLDARSAGLNLHPVFFTTFTLTNPDTLPIERVTVTWRSSTDTTCLGQEKSHTYHLNLLPNKDTTLHLQLVDSFLTPLSNYDICLTTSSPHGKLGYGTPPSTCTRELLPPIGLPEPAQHHWKPPTTAQPGMTIALPGHMEYQWRSLTGKTIYRGKGAALPVPGHLPSGLYFIVIGANNQPQAFKVYVF